MRKARSPRAPPSPSRRRALAALAALSATPIAGRAAESESAAAWPTRPIRIVASISAGTSLDTLARMTGTYLSTALGQPVFVENQAGAAGNLASALVARAEPNGNTLLFTSNVITTVPALLGSRAVDPLTALAPVSIVASQPVIMVANPSFQGTGFADVVLRAKSSPGTVAYATSGIGSLAHLTALWVQSRAGIRMLHVPYSASQSFRDVLSGEVPFGFTLFATALPLVRNGQLKAIAITAPARSSIAPEIPTLHESGLADVQVQNWQGLLAPAGTSPNVIARLHAELVKMSGNHDIDARLRGMGYTPVFNTPVEFAEEIRRETQRWASIVKAADLRLD